MLNINFITKSLRNKKILDNLSLQVGRGEIAVLLGASGVGKSTLLRVLNNLETVDAGTVTLDGALLDLSKVNQTHTVGMVFQHFNLFEHLTVERNITLVLEEVLHQNKQDAHHNAQVLLTNYGLKDKAMHVVAELSGGQKQRLAIARTLALKPTVVCLDEPTSALDPLLTTYVANSIQELAQQGYIVLVATHDTSMLTKMPCTLYLMNEGRIVESVQSQEFFANKEKYPSIAAFVAGVAN